jgi:hypothetical protein
MPYDYTVAPASDVPSAVKAGAGATLFAADATTIRPLTQHAGEDEQGPFYNLRGQRVDSSYKGLVICNGRKLLK